MRCVVTGGAGFIGSHLTDHLLREGHDVTVLARPDEDTGNLERPCTIVRGDLLDRALVADLVPAADVIYHLGARTDLVGTSLEDYAVNVAGTENVCELARRCKAGRLVLYSSMLAVGLSDDGAPVDESRTEPNALAYGQSKRAAEEIVARSGVPWTAIRPTQVYGPRERSTMLEFLRAIRRRQFMLIGPDVLQSFVYVKNLVHATYLASLSSAAAEKVYYVDDASPCTLAEFARVAAQACGTPLIPVRLPRPLAMAGALLLQGFGKLTGIPVPLTPSRVRTMTTPRVYSTERARRDFGYAPPFDLSSALHETAQWYREKRLI